MKYVVKYGDSLTKIAKRIGGTVNDIRLANPQLHGEDTIYPGQVLEVPLDEDLTKQLFKIMDVMASAYGADSPDCANSKCDGLKSGTITVRVTSGPKDTVGVAHKLTIESASGDRKDTFGAVDEAGAVRTEYGLKRPYPEGRYKVTVEPFPPPGQSIGPKPLGDDFVGEVSVVHGRENNFLLHITRKQAIVHNIFMRFEVAPNPHADSTAPLHEDITASAVPENLGLIEAEAAAQGVDADLIKAVMHMETTHGWYDFVLAPFDKNKSILPMNVYSDYWKELATYLDFFTRDNLKKTGPNIKAGTFLLKRLADRVQPRSIEGIATVYNPLSADKVNDYGARVRAIYDGKLWLKVEEARKFQFEMLQRQMEFDSLMYR